MRIKEITKPVAEESNPVFKITFKSDVGVLQSPISVVWDLTLLDGTIIAYQQEILSVSSVIYLALSTENTRLMPDEGLSGERILYITVTYLSDRTGTELIDRAKVKFTIMNYLLVAQPIDINVSDVVFTDDYIRDLATA